MHACEGIHTLNALKNVRPRKRAKGGKSERKVRNPCGKPVDVKILPIESSIKGRFVVITTQRIVETWAVRSREVRVAQRKAKEMVTVAYSMKKMNCTPGKTLANIPILYPEGRATRFTSIMNTSAKTM